MTDKTRPLLSPDRRLYRSKEVMAALGIGHTTFYRWLNSGVIPKPVYFGNSRTPFWIAPEIDALINQAAANRDMELARAA
jgi:predicted DNA-binding transcriptional regulator AlpA